MSEQNNVEQKKSALKGHMPCDFIYIKFKPGKSNLRDRTLGGGDEKRLLGGTEGASVFLLIFFNLGANSMGVFTV